MAWFLFIDESGQDGGESPYEVLAGVAIKDRSLWRLIVRLHEAEMARFGRRYSAGEREIKAKKILKRKTFQHLALNAKVEDALVPVLARAALDDGQACGTPAHLRALAQAKLWYVEDVLSICSAEGCKVFGSVVEKDAPLSSSDGLRKEYAYLFERFFYFLQDLHRDSGRDEQGIIVFDELEKSRSHILIDQAQRYFRDTATGQERSVYVIPEPFFVHSELTTGIQIADLVAYIVSWGFRTANINKPARPELKAFADTIAGMRYRAVRERLGNPSYTIWSIAHIQDRRTAAERA